MGLFNSTPEPTTYRVRLTMPYFEARAFRDLCLADGCAKVYLPGMGTGPVLGIVIPPADTQVKVEILTWMPAKLHATVARFNARRGLQIEIDDQLPKEDTPRE
jgi:hypothetical protein